MKTYFLILTSAVGLAGELKRAGSVVQVAEADAKNLLHRGKARTATPEECAAAGFEPEAEANEDADAGDGSEATAKAATEDKAAKATAKAAAKK